MESGLGEVSTNPFYSTVLEHLIKMNKDEKLSANIFRADRDLQTGQQPQSLHAFWIFNGHTELFENGVKHQEFTDIAE